MTTVVASCRGDNDAEVPLNPMSPEFDVGSSCSGPDDPYCHDGIYPVTFGGDDYPRVDYSIRYNINPYGSCGHYQMWLLDALGRGNISHYYARTGNPYYGDWHAEISSSVLGNIPPMVHYYRWQDRTQLAYTLIHEAAHQYGYLDNPPSGVNSAEDEAIRCYIPG